jgi:hypothetical protein
MGQHRACIGFDLFQKWNEEKVFFVTRMKKCLIRRNLKKKRS